MDATAHNGPGGLLAAAGVMTVISLLPTLTTILQFITAAVGAFFAVMAFYKWVRKKLKENKDSNE